MRKIFDIHKINLIKEARQLNKLLISLRFITNSEYDELKYYDTLIDNKNEKDLKSDIKNIKKRN